MFLNHLDSNIVKAEDDEAASPEAQQEINSLSAANLNNLQAIANDNVPRGARDEAIRSARFGLFEVDFKIRELRKQGLRVRIQYKPLQILERLLQSRGEFVTRVELAQHLWPNLNVVFDRSLNTAVNALRRVLGDPFRNPRFIETRAGLGYRFIAPVECLADPSPRRPLKQSSAYLDYLKGRYFCDKMNEADLRKSVAYLEAALAADPGYAPAYAGLADAYNLFAEFGILSPKDALTQVKKFAAAALRIDDTIAEAHVSLASVRKLMDWDWQGAEREYRRALELDTHSARVHHHYAVHLAAMQRHGEALEEIRLAKELDPLSLAVNMEAAWILYMARDYQGALEQSWRTLAMEPRFAHAQNTLGLAYEQLGAVEEAVVEFRNARTCSDDHPAAIATLGHALARAQMREGCLDCMREIESMAERRYVSPFWMAILLTGLGEHGRALDALERAYQDHDVWLVWIKAEPRLDPLRSHRRFCELLTSVWPNG